MDEETLTLQDLGRFAESLAETVFEKHDKLMERLSVQDVQFKSIWDAYKSIGIIDTHHARNLIDPIRARLAKAKDEAPYWEKYHQTNRELDRLLGLLKDDNNQLGVLQEIEKIIVDLIMLLNFQWDVLVAQLGSITKKIKLRRDTELAKVDEYLAIVHTLNDHPQGRSIKEAYAFEKQELILQQIELFQTEQRILDQMEFVCNERDRLFPIISELFLK